MPPPSWAKSATKLAPKPYPTIISGILPVMSGVLRMKAYSSAYRPPTPSSERETTISPDTAPPRSATWIASLPDRRAAEAARMLVRTETHIPV